MSHRRAVRLRGQCIPPAPEEEEPGSPHGVAMPIDALTDSGRLAYCCCSLSCSSRSCSGQGGQGGQGGEQRVRIILLATGEGGEGRGALGRQARGREGYGASLLLASTRILYVANTILYVACLLLAGELIGGRLGRALRRLVVIEGPGDNAGGLELEALDDASEVTPDGPEEVEK